MKPISKLLAASAAILLCGLQANAFAAASTVTTVASFPVNIEATACNGDTVALTGNLNVVAHVSQSASGNLNVEINVDSQGLSGTGLPSGTTYQANSHAHDMFDATAGFTTTVVDKFVLIAKGKNPDMITTMTFHYTINADNTVTATVDTFTVKCTG